MMISVRCPFLSARIWRFHQNILRRGFSGIIWKPCVIDFLNIDSPDLEVSNMGQVRRVKTGHLMKGSLWARPNYIAVNVRQACGVRKKVSLHRLVCALYNGPPPSSNENIIHHKNHNPGDNVASNLEWITQKKNSQKYRRTFPESASIVHVPLIQLSLDGHFIQEFESVKSAALSINGTSHGICKSMKLGKSYKNFLWKRKVSKIANDNPDEVWRTCRNHPQYSVSNHGRVKHTKKNTLLSTTGQEYPKVSINKKSVMVHRLVATEYVCNDSEKPFVDHIDGDKENNHFTNLRWVDSVENQLNPATYWKLCKPVNQHSKNGELIATFGSILEASKVTGTQSTCITRCCKGIRKTAGGYVWTYSE